MKGLAYKTVWVEFPDIVEVCKKIGAKPTSIKPDGNPHYTLPAIQDPKTGAVITDSFAIARYLDETYPDTITVLPSGTIALQTVFVDVVSKNMRSAARQLYALPLWRILGPRSQEYVRRTREATFGKRLEDVAPEGGEEEKQARVQILEVLTEIHRWIEVNGKGSLFVTGDEPSFSDVLLASNLQSFKLLYGVESELWKSLMVTNDGRWGKLAEIFAKWNAVA
jgi:glutathione S-transferase